MNTRASVMAAFLVVLVLCVCGELGAASVANAGVAEPAGGAEIILSVARCVLITPRGDFEGPCERVEWGGPSFLIRQADGRAFVDGITEVLVEVETPGARVSGSFRRGKGGLIVPIGPLTFVDDCACWVRPDFTVGATPR